MNVLALTILISVFLAAIFIVCFIAELKRNKRRGIEHDALLPLDDDAGLTSAPRPNNSNSDRTEEPQALPTNTQ